MAKKIADNKDIVIMKDRDLLDYAAKAAGIAGIKWHESGEGGWLDGCGAPSTWWNPLTDDGDALRMAVELEIAVKFTAIRSIAKWVNVRCQERYLNDKKAATRRAIVRVAAEIGKAM